MSRDILDAIDTACEDWLVSEDAMRSRPDGSPDDVGGNGYTRASSEITGWRVFVNGHEISHDDAERLMPGLTFGVMASNVQSTFDDLMDLYDRELIEPRHLLAHADLSPYLRPTRAPGPRLPSWAWENDIASDYRTSLIREERQPPDWVQNVDWVPNVRWRP